MDSPNSEDNLSGRGALEQGLDFDFRTAGPKIKKPPVTDALAASGMLLRTD